LIGRGAWKVYSFLKFGSQKPLFVYGRFAPGHHGPQSVRPFRVQNISNLDFEKTMGYSYRGVYIIRRQAVELLLTSK